MSARSLDYIINLKDGNFTSGMNNARNQTSGLDRTFKSLTATAAGFFTLRSAAQFVKESTQMSAKLEALDVQLKSFSGAGEYAKNVSFLERTIEDLKTPSIEAREEFTKFYTASTNAGLSAEKSRRTFYAMAIAQRVGGLEGQKFGLAMNALTQMVGKGTVQAEELKGQLGEQFPIAMGIAARAYGVTTKQLLKNIQDGKVQGIDFVDKFSKRLIQEFEGKIPAAMKTTRARMDQLGNSMSNLKKTLGDALAPSMGKVMENFAGFADAVSRVITGQTPLADKIRETKFQLNAEFEVLKEGNISLDNRKELIDSINSQAGEYLDNLLDEKSTIQDITKAQNELNESLDKKIAITARNEILGDYIKQMGKIQKTILELKTEQKKYQIGEVDENGKVTGQSPKMVQHYQKMIDVDLGWFKKLTKEYKFAEKTTNDILDSMNINPQTVKTVLGGGDGKPGTATVPPSGKKAGDLGTGTNPPLTGGTSQSVSGGRSVRNINIEIKQLVGSVTYNVAQDSKQSISNTQKMVQDALVRAVLDAEGAI